MPRTRAYSYYRNRICQIEVEMLSAFPCHLASVYRLIVCLPVCLFVRLPASPSSHCPFWQLHSLLVSVLDSVSVSDSVLVSVSLSGLGLCLGLGLGLLARSPFAVCSLLDCLLIWRADAYQLPFLLAFRLRRSRLLSTKKIHCLLLRARPSKLLA